MSDTVAAKNQDVLTILAFCCFMNDFIKTNDQLCRGFRMVMEAPAAIRQPGPHLKSPAAKDIIGRKIVFDQLISPVSKLSDILCDMFQNLRHRNIEHLCIALQSPLCRNIRRMIVQRSEPDAGAHIFCPHLRSELSHVPVIRIANPPGTSVIRIAVINLPAVIHHHKRAVFDALRHLRKICAVSEDFPCRAFSIGIVPVVPAVNYSISTVGIVAHLAAKRPAGFKYFYRRIGFFQHIGRHNDPCSFQLPSAKLHAVRPAAHVQMQLYIRTVLFPPAHGRWTHLYTKCQAFSRFMPEKVPRHSDMICLLFPFQITVTAFPGVPEHLARPTKHSFPGKHKLPNRCVLCLHEYRKAAISFRKLHCNVTCSESSCIGRGLLLRLRTACHQPDLIRLSQQVSFLFCFHYPFPSC